MNIRIAEQAIVDHIAEHIHDFSLLSLPWAPEEDENELTRIQQSTALVDAWCSGATAQDVAKTIPEISKCQASSTHYFHQNEYFAESANSSKSSVESRRSASVSTTRRELENMRKEGSLSFPSEDEAEIEKEIYDQSSYKTSRDERVAKVHRLIRASYVESFDGRKDASP